MNNRTETAMDLALDAARSEYRSHSLIPSQRTWQKVASAPGVAAWGYAYEDGQFHRDPAVDRAFPCRACKGAGSCSVCHTL